MFDINMIKTSSGPLLLLQNGMRKKANMLSVQQLTGSTKRLVEVGLSLYNGYEIGLDDVFGSIVSDELIYIFPIM